MGEGGGSFESWERKIGKKERVEQSLESKEEKEEREKRELALEILKLQSQLIEGGMEWDAAHRQAIRNQIQDGLAKLGVTDVADERFYNILHPPQNFAPKVPEDYPSFEEFEKKFQEILKTENRPQGIRWEQAPNLEEFIKYVYVEDWRQIKSRNLMAETEQFLYQLGKELCDRRSYRRAFPPVSGKEDNISVRRDGWLQNGRHRTLTLKCLGTDFINRHGLGNFIKIELEEI